MTELEEARATAAALTTDLADARKELELTRADFYAENERFRAELRARADTILSLAAKLSDQQSATRRANGSIVQLCRALRDLVNATKPRRSPQINREEVAELLRAHKAAAEVLALVDIPF